MNDSVRPGRCLPARQPLLEHLLGLGELHLEDGQEEVEDKVGTQHHLQVAVCGVGVGVEAGACSMCMLRLQWTGQINGSGVCICVCVDVRWSKNQYF